MYLRRGVSYYDHSFNTLYTLDTDCRSPDYDTVSVQSTQPPVTGGYSRVQSDSWGVMLCYVCIYSSSIDVHRAISRNLGYSRVRVWPALPSVDNDRQWGSLACIHHRQCIHPAAFVRAVAVSLVCVTGDFSSQLTVEKTALLGLELGTFQLKGPRAIHCAKSQVLNLVIRLSDVRPFPRIKRRGGIRMIHDFFPKYWNGNPFSSNNQIKIKIKRRNAGRKCWINDFRRRILKFHIAYRLSAI